jgi:hypothetical protein
MFLAVGLLGALVECACHWQGTGGHRNDGWRSVLQALTLTMQADRATGRMSVEQPSRWRGAAL